MSGPLFRKIDAYLIKAGDLDAAIVFYGAPRSLIPEILKGRDADSLILRRYLVSPTTRFFASVTNVPLD